MPASRSCLSSLKTPSSLVEPRFEASARPRFSNSCVTSCRCCRTLIHPWKTRKDTTMGTTDQKIRARKLEKPRNQENAVIASPSLDHARGTRQEGRRDLQAELLRRLEVQGEGHLPGGRVRNLRGRTAPEYRLGELPGLTADVLTAGE